MIELIKESDMIDGTEAAEHLCSENTFCLFAVDFEILDVDLDIFIGLIVDIEDRVDRFIVRKTFIYEFDPVIVINRLAALVVAAVKAAEASS